MPILTETATKVPQKHQHEAAVSMQWALDSLLTVGQSCAAIRRHLGRYIDLPYGLNLLSSEWPPFLEQLRALHSSLATYPSSTGGGALDHLRDDCFLLMRQLPDAAGIKKLSAVVLRAWREGQQAAYLLALETHFSFDDRAQLCRVLHKLNILVAVAIQLVPEAAAPLRDDENLLFYLLTHRRELDALNPGQSVARTFQDWYPDGIQSLGQQLTVRYTERSFHDLLPTIEILLASLPAW